MPELIIDIATHITGGAICFLLSLVIVGGISSLGGKNG
jgi:hypothetical protein